MPDGRRIRTAFANIVIPGMPFGCCMDIPQEMSLKEIDGALKLCAEPIKEIQSLYSDIDIYEEISVDRDNSFDHITDAKCCDIELSITDRESFTVSLFGLSIEYDAATKKLKCLDRIAPVQGINGIITLRILYDVSYTEIYADAGCVFMGISSALDSNLNMLTIVSSDAIIKKLRVSELKAFHC